MFLNPADIYKISSVDLNENIKKLKIFLKSSMLAIKMYKLLHIFNSRNILQLYIVLNICHSVQYQYGKGLLGLQ